MALRDEDVSSVRAAADVVAVVSEHVGLKKVGRRWVGLCPFHAEKSPSFSVNAEQGLYYCFGCGARGDVISFVREVEHLDFVEAVEKLAARSGIALQHTDERGNDDRKRRKTLVGTMQKAIDFYHERLLNSEDGAKARSYLRSRGYTGDVVREFKIGWAPDDWDQLVKHLDVSADVLNDTGLGFVNRRNRQQDAFRGRVMFPIFDQNGEAMALGGRILEAPSEGKPKYKNSPETKLYSKRRVLYGMNWAKDPAVRSGELVVCEGYTDVIGFALSGVPQAVATCGTALGEEHVRLLKKYASRVVLAYDADNAGQTAAERFYEWERKFEVDLYVATFPNGSDPADLAKSNPEALRQAVKDAKPYLEFRLDRVLNAADLRSPETRARSVDKALAIVNEHPSSLVRDQYVITVADRLRFDIEQVRRSLEALRSGAPRPQAGAANASNGEPIDDGYASNSPTFKTRQEAVDASRGGSQSTSRAQRKGGESRNAERTAVLLATQHPGDVAELLQFLQPSIDSAAPDAPDGLSRLCDVLFTDGLYLGSFTSLLEANDLSEAIERSSAEVGELLSRLAVEDEPPPIDGTTADQVADCFSMLFWSATQRATKELRIRSSETGQTFDLGEIKAAAEQLLGSAQRLLAMRRLVPWLLRTVEGE